MFAPNGGMQTFVMFRRAGFPSNGSQLPGSLHFVRNLKWSLPRYCTRYNGKHIRPLRNHSEAGKLFAPHVATIELYGNIPVYTVQMTIYPSYVVGVVPQCEARLRGCAGAELHYVIRRSVQERLGAGLDLSAAPKNEAERNRGPPPGGRSTERPRRRVNALGSARS